MKLPVIRFCRVGIEEQRADGFEFHIGYIVHLQAARRLLRQRVDVDAVMNPERAFARTVREVCLTR